MLWSYKQKKHQEPMTGNVTEEFPKSKPYTAKFCIFETAAFPKQCHKYNMALTQITASLPFDRL